MIADAISSLGTIGICVGIVLIFWKITHAGERRNYGKQRSPRRMP